MKNHIHFSNAFLSEFNEKFFFKSLISGPKMSKKDRVKANAKPAKSDAAASFLGTSQAFIGFDTQDCFVLAPEIHAQLKKLNKKDSNTKIKSLQDLQEIIPSNDNSTWVNLIPQWCRFYPKLCTDEDTMVRKNSHLFHTLIVTRTKKEFTPYLKQVTGYWLLSMFDPYPPAAREAKTSFFSTFLDDKWTKVLLFCKTEIFELLSDLLNTEMSSLDSDEERASLKYYRIIGQSLALALFLLQSGASGYRESMRTDIIPNLFQKPKLIKLIELPDTSVQKNYVALLGELVKEDLIVVFDVEEAQTSINLKPLENVALEDMDVKIVEDIWKVIVPLEKSKMFCRTSKHEKQWLSKINELVATRFEHLSLVSAYIISSTVLEPHVKAEWFACLSNELTLALQEKSSRIPILNEYLQAILYWLGTDQEDQVISLILNLLSEMRQDSNHILFACDFCASVHNYSIKNKNFCAKVIQFLSHCFEELVSQSDFSAICLDRLLKLENTLRRVRIDPSSNATQKCEKLINVYSRYINVVEDLISHSFTVLDLCTSIYSELIAKQSSEFHFSSGQFVKMMEKCLKDPQNLASRCASICKLACLSGFSLLQYEEVFEHIIDSRITCQLLSAELQLNKVLLLESDILLNSVSQKCDHNILRIVYGNLDKMKSERIRDYIAVLEKVEGDEFFDLAEILLKKLSNAETEFRKTVYSSVLNRSCDALDSKFSSLTDSYLSCRTETEDLKEFFWFFTNPDSGHNLTKLQVRCLCRKLFEAAENAQKEKFSQFCVETLLKMLSQRAKRHKKMMQFLFEFNGLLLPHQKFRAHTLSKFSLSDIDQFVDFVKDVHQLSLTVSDTEVVSIGKWVSDIRLLSRVLVPFKDESDATEIIENPAILLVAETEIFKLITNSLPGNSGDTCEQLIDSESLPEKDLNALFGKVTMEQITQYFYQLLGRSSISPLTYGNMLRVLMQVEEYLWDGFDLMNYETTILLLNRQILYGMEWQLKRLNDGIGMEKLEDLWDTYLCCLVCYGKNLSSTETIFKNALYLSFGHVFMNCYSELIVLVSNLDQDRFSTIVDEWDEVFRLDFEESVCAYCVKLIKSDLPDRFFTKKFVEYNGLNSAKPKHLIKTLDSLRGESNYVSYISPCLLSRNYKVQTLAFNILQKLADATQEFDLESVKMLIEVAEMSSVGYDLMQSLLDQEGPLQKIEVADPETHSSVLTFIRANQLVFQNLGKEKPSVVRELLQNELSHLNYEIFFSILLGLTDYKHDYSKSSLSELSSKTASKDANCLHHLATSCLLAVLIHTPTLCQNWFEKLDRRRRDFADQFVSTYLSPIIIKQTFDAIIAETIADNSDNRLTIKTLLSERTVRAQYSIEDFAVDVKMSFAKNYPLGRISIEEIKKKKIGMQCISVGTSISYCLSFLYCSFFVSNFCCQKQTVFHYSGK